MAKFKDTYGHSDPNSTDVHAVYKVKDLAAYVAKYLSKSDTSSAAITGRIWGCNQELSANSKLHLFVDRDECHITMKALMCPAIEYKAIEVLNKLTQLPRKIGELFFVRPINWMLHIKGRIKEAYQKQCWRIRNMVTDDSLYSGFDYDLPAFSVG
jgi:hypothetical protein